MHLKGGCIKYKFRKLSHTERLYLVGRARFNLAIQEATRGRWKRSRFSLNLSSLKTFEPNQSEILLNLIGELQRGNS